MKACKNCKALNEKKAGQCWNCKQTNFATSHKGRITVIDPEKSEIAQKMGITVKGEFAIKVN